MRLLLRDLSPGQKYAISFRSNDGAGNVSDWSQVQTFTTTADTMPPASIQNLTWYNSGSSFIGQWDKVTTNRDGTPLKDFRDYHCNVSNGSTSIDLYVTGEYIEFTNAQNLAQFGTLQTALTITVTARDNTYNESTPVSLHVDPAAPPTPSKPGVGNYLGLLLVSWDSKTNSGANMYASDHNFNYCEVHVSTTSGFTPSAATLAGRVFSDGSAAKTTVSDLTVGVTYYVRLVAVNLLGKRSGPSDEASGSPGRITGLDIQNGQISAEQINWKATGIPGGDAYYSTSQPTDPIDGVSFHVGDVWYDTDNGYESWSWNGTTWVKDPSIGFIPGGKIIAGTITADKVGANEIITASANIANAVIDDAKITSLSVAKLIAGSIAAEQYVAAGPITGMHAEMRDTGFYVMVPAPNFDPVTNPLLLPQIKMGTGDGDNFSIVNPNSPDSTLASVDTNGIGSFQGLYVENDPIIQGQQLVGGLIKSKAELVGEGIVGPFTGLNQAGAMGIRGEYGLGQFSFPVEAGRTYEIFGRVNSVAPNGAVQGGFYVNDGGEIQHKLRLQKDQRTPTDINNGVSPTAVTINSTVIAFDQHSNFINTFGQHRDIRAFWRSDFTGIVTIGYSLTLAAPAGADSVIKIVDGSYLEFKAIDYGRSMVQSGQPNSYGAALYSWTAPPPPPPPSVQNYSWSGHANWVRSYKSNNGYMTNTNGLAYQGTDPSGFNGNQKAYYGFSQVDLASALSGASNIHITLYLYYAHWYNNSGGTAVIGYHPVWGDPGTANYQGGSSNLTQVGGVPKPGSFNIDVSGWAGAMQNGSFRGILLGPAPSSSLTYYGYASDCALTVTYTK